MVLLANRDINGQGGLMSLAETDRFLCERLSQLNYVLPLEAIALGELEGALRSEAEALCRSVRRWRSS